MLLAYVFFQHEVVDLVCMEVYRVTASLIFRIYHGTKWCCVSCCSCVCCTSFKHTPLLSTLAGGTLSNSLAIMTDAAHMLSDFASFLISLFAIWIASRSPTKMMSFGWHRAGM